MRAACIAYHYSWREVGSFDCHVQLVSLLDVWLSLVDPFNGLDAGPFRPFLPFGEVEELSPLDRARRMAVVKQGSYDFSHPFGRACNLDLRP